jgi:hypothetical protein
MAAKTPKPFTVYTILAILIVVSLVVLYANRNQVSSAITGLVTGFVPVQNPNPNPSSSFECPAPGANSSCGAPCWLKTSGNAPAANFSEAQGKIGVIDWDGKCRDISEYVQNQYCCCDAECPMDKPKCGGMVGSITVRGRCIKEQ